MKKIHHPDTPEGIEQAEKVSYALARAFFELTAEEGEQWDEHEHYGLPRVVFDALAHTAMIALGAEEPTAERQPKHASDE